MIAFDDEVRRFYARALVAVARADGEINASEGQRLEHTLTARFGEPVSLTDLLLERPLLSREAVGLRTTGELAMGPFRSMQLDRNELAEMFVVDAVAVAGDCLETSVEVVIVRIARALGMTSEEARASIGIRR